MQNNRNSKDLPHLITVRLDKEQERRLNALAFSLGISKVQVLHDLLSADYVQVSGVCKKAKSIPLYLLNEEEIARQMAHASTSSYSVKAKVLNLIDENEEWIRKKVNEFEQELRAKLSEKV